MSANLVAVSEWSTKWCQRTVDAIAADCAETAVETESVTTQSAYLTPIAVSLATMSLERIRAILQLRASPMD